MPTQLINSFASWVLKQRIHQIELFLKYPNEVQDELLMGLIQSAKNTELGNEYDYLHTSYATFAERVPISTYEEFQPLIERNVMENKYILGNSYKMVCKIKRNY
jgi:hypothetical protein